jgi:LacI family transcriptional regulator
VTSVPPSLSARTAALRLLARRSRPTAVFCQADSIAYAVYLACAELGLEIPGDVSVCGFDDHPLSRVVAPPLTSVDWGLEVLARVATGFLADALDGHPQHRLATMPPALRVRASTARPTT